jgi:uncharacterized protein YegJ (DUF2314 family)
MDSAGLARQGFRTFLQKLRSPAKGQEYFSVAVPGDVVGAGQERVWVDGLELRGETMEGRVVSRSRGQFQSACGKVVRFPATEVCDWMIVENGSVEGAYSLR